MIFSSLYRRAFYVRHVQHIIFGMIFASCTTLGVSVSATTKPSDITENRVAFLVNHEAIFTKGLEERLRFVAFSMGLSLDSNTFNMLRSSVVRGMIDEILQRQTALNMGIKITDAEIQNAISEIEKNNGMKTGRLISTLRQNNINPDTFMMQIKSQLLWMSYIRQKYERSLTITSQEIEAFKERLKEKHCQTHYNLAEIVLYINGAEEVSFIKKQMEQIIEWLMQGTPFPQVARQFSQSATAAQGGYKGWVTADELELNVEKVLNQTEAGSLTHPIRTTSGYSVFAIIDKKVPSKNDTIAIPSDEQISHMLRGERLERLARLELASLHKRIPVEIRVSL